MTIQQAIIFATLLLTLVLFVTGRWRYDVVALLALMILTPIGHQSNTLVMGPGGYRFGDYWRMGLLLEAIVVLVAVPLILACWPLGR